MKSSVVKNDFKIEEITKKTTIFDFINDKEIDEKEYCELTNDYEFMLEVITLTKSKIYYDICSEKLKDNPNFIIEVMDNFMTDTKSLLEITRTCLKSDPSNVNLFRVYAKLYEIHTITKDPKLSIYEYSSFNAINRIYKKTIMNEQSKYNEGLNFYVAKELFETDENALKHTAMYLLKQIFSEEDEFNLENYLHRKVNNFVNYDLVQINKLLLDFISLHDHDLSIYIENNFYLLSEYISNCLEIQQIWYSYNTRVINEIKKDINNRRILVRDLKGYSLNSILLYMNKKNNLPEVTNYFQNSYTKFQQKIYSIEANELHKNISFPSKNKLTLIFNKIYNISYPKLNYNIEKIETNNIIRLRSKENDN